MAIETTPETTEMMRTLPRAAYLSEEHFALESEHIFHHEWFVVGREAAIPSPGDYLHVEVAGESVLIVRARSGELGAFHNVCRHRGSRLVMDDPPVGDGRTASGRFKGSIRCPYHAWTYGLDGTAPQRAVPHRERRAPPGAAEPVPGRGRHVGGLRVREPHAVGADARACARVAARRPDRADRELPARGAPRRASHHVRHRRELEDDRRELQRVLSLRPSASRALRAGPRVQARAAAASSIGTRVFRTATVRRRSRSRGRRRASRSPGSPTTSACATRAS